MVFFKININFFYKLFLSFFFIIFFNIFFYIVIENFFLYSFVENINNKNYYISFFFFSFFFIFFFIFIFIYNKKNKNYIVIKIFNLKVKKEFKILLFINCIGILAYIIFKLIPLFYFLSTKTDYQNLYCIFIDNKNYILERDSLASNIDNYFIQFANKFSWVGTLLLNFFYVTIFFVILFFKKLRSKYKIISLILTLTSVSLYLFVSGSKMILLSFITIVFTSLLFSYSLNLISLRRFLAFSLFFFFFALSIYFIIQLSRTNCIKSNVQEYDSNTEFNTKNFYRKTDSNINFINYSRTIINNSITVNYSLFYILAGKLSGDHLLDIDKKNKINKGNFIYLKQVYNKMNSDIRKIGITKFAYLKYDQNFLERLNPVVSLYHILFRDFGFLNLTILIFFFLLVFFQFKYIKNTFSLFIFTYFMLFFFYFVSNLGFINLAATFNANIIFFNFFVYFLFFFLRVKIKIE
jgi:hypothetical protein